MGSYGSTLHQCVWLAHLWRRAPRGDRYLCKKKSAFPRMTTGMFSGILESIQAVRIAPALKRKGRKHEYTFIRMVTGRSGRGAALRLLRCVPQASAQFESDVVAGYSAAVRHKERAELVLGLPPAPHGPSYWSCYQHSHLRKSWAIGPSHRPTPNPSIEPNREGKRQASSLTCSSRQAWADGRRNEQL
jgi:hypothetical protein